MTSAGAMRQNVRAWLTGCIFLLFVAACYMYLIPSDRSYVSREDAQQTAFDFLWATKRKLSLDLTSEILYSRRCIEAVPSNKARRDEVETIAEPLITNPVTLQLARQGSELPPGEDSLPDCTPLKLSTPRPHAAGEKFSHLMFGMATTFARLQESLESIEHWASGADCKLYVMVEDYTARPAEVLELQLLYRSRGVQAHFVAPLSDATSTSQNHFLVLTRMVEEARGPEAQWFGLLDDDTFFPHLGPLSDALARLDHRGADVYAGALSEDFGSVRNFGIMAYGGAGAYLSVHLAEKLGALDLATACLDEAPENLGDILLRNCVYHHSRAKLTPLQGLFQHDLLGDMSGFFESGVQPLNLHHWRSWYHEPVVRMAAAAKFCGDCFLQRWMFGADTVLSNGYSITVYPPDVLENLDLERTEHTWNQIYEDMNPEYDFTIGPLRDRVPGEVKKSYRLVDTDVSAHGRVMKQLYMFQGDRDMDELDEVVELIWRL